MANQQVIFASYPDTLGKEAKQGQHYVLFNSYESTSAIKQGKLKSSIALYIPPGALQVTTGQDYGPVQGGATMAAAARGATSGWGDGWDKGISDWGGNVLDKFGRIFQGAGDVATGQLTRAEAAQNFMSSAFGLAKNNHVALAYKGPNAFRTHSFTFQFFPKNTDEARQVGIIIKDFEDGSTPRMVGGKDKKRVDRITAPFFAAPRQWDIKFMRGTKRGGSGQRPFSGGENNYLHKLKRSVITSMTINHDPDSVVSFHADGSPVHSSLTIAFQELEYVTSQDHVDADFNDSVYEASQRNQQFTSSQGGLTNQQKKNLAAMSERTRDRHP